MSQLTVAQRIAKRLKQYGVEYIFAQSLPSALILAAEDCGIRQIVYRTENAGGAMADGYARRSGKIGVVAAQNGPAATLLVPPLAEAIKASIPVIAFVQEVNRSDMDRNAFQDFDQIELFSSCTKYVRRVMEASRIEDYIDMAITAATTGRPGPVALLLPADLLNEAVQRVAERQPGKLGRWPLDRTVADQASVSKVAELLINAQSPLVVAGGGVHGSNASKQVAMLQQQAGLPVAYTMMGKGAIADEHPLTLGLIGNVMGDNSLGHYTRPLLDAADVIFLIGTRTNQNGTDNWRLFPETATVIHLDIDGNEVGRNYDSMRLVGDAGLTLEALMKTLQASDLSNRESTRVHFESQIGEARAAYTKATNAISGSKAAPIRPERIMREIQTVLTSEAPVVADASYSSVWINTYLRALEPGMRFICPRGLAGLGWGFPMALGAKLARPGGPVICVVGDGGFGHCWSELETARRMNIPVVLIVLNNSVLGFQKDAETVKFGRYTSACHFNPVDHKAIAQACGVAAVQITDSEDIGPQLQLALKSNEMTLLDIMTDPNAYPPLTLFDGQFEEQ